MSPMDLCRRAGKWAPLAAMSMFAAGCGDAALKETSFGQMSDLVTAVATVDGTAGLLLGGDRPAAAGGPTVSVTGVPTAINGGSLRATVTAPTAFSRVIVSLQYLDGYYQVDLPAPVTAVDLVLTLSPNTPQATMAFLYGAAPAGGPLGTSSTQPVNLIRVGSGDVQVSVAWDAPTDVDLHVTDPSGERIYFANATSESGGTLDLDSNAACSIDNVNNENVVWPTGEAPSGQYVVELVYWSACSQPQTRYSVTVLVQGQQPQVFSGTMVTSNANTRVPIGTFVK